MSAALLEDSPSRTDYSGAARVPESALRTVFDRTAAAAGLLVLLPVVLPIAVAIVLNDGFPVFFRQQRVGRGGRTFALWKFRSMRKNNSTAQITASGDERITAVGRILRKYKLDELPQLWNVLRGEMSLIGPRPEVPCYVDMADPVWRQVLAVRPGITDLATLIFRNEEEILAKAPDPERCYREEVLPQKQALNMDYIQRRNWLVDLKLLLWTVRFSFAPAGFRSEQIKTRIIG
jgi:lipopolysaccharide/colanic/teichoic acid biosynthesis glycosyltransferase